MDVVINEKVKMLPWYWYDIRAMVRAIY
jgi:hypothetical protein